MMFEKTLTPQRTLRATGILSIIVALAAMAADEILQYWPQGYASLTYYQTLPFWRLFAGHLLGVLTIPLCLIGYWCICQALKLGGARHTNLLFWLIAYSLVMGAISHDSISLVYILFHYGAGPAFNPIINYAQGVANVPGSIFLLGYLLASAWYCVAVLTRHSLYPRWMAFYNPFLLSFLIALLYTSGALPMIMNVLWPAWLSVAHVLFFTLSTVVLWHRAELPSQAA